MEIEDTKAEFVMELLENFSFVRVEPVLEDDEIPDESEEIEAVVPSVPIEPVEKEPVKPAKKSRRKPKRKS